MRDRKSILRKEKQSISEINYTKQNLRNVSDRFITSFEEAFKLPWVYPAFHRFVGKDNSVAI